MKILLFVSVVLLVVAAMLVDVEARCKIENGQVNCTR